MVVEERENITAWDQNAAVLQYHGSIVPWCYRTMLLWERFIVVAWHCSVIVELQHRIVPPPSKLTRHLSLKSPDHETSQTTWPKPAQ